MKVIFTVEISENLISVMKEDLKNQKPVARAVRQAIIDTARDIIGDKNEDSVTFDPPTY